MTDLSTLLKAADPVARDEALSRDDAQRMRREALAALPERVAHVPLWNRPFGLAVAAALIAAVSGVAGHRSRAVVADDPATAVALPDGGSSGVNDKRQLQFATPGGTRIIWIFDESLRFQESLP
jgi:hypothetical protein